jgi:hypothetical protein
VRQVTRPIAFANPDEEKCEYAGLPLSLFVPPSARLLLAFIAEYRLVFSGRARSRSDPMMVAVGFSPRTKHRDERVA